MLVLLTFRNKCQVDSFSGRQERGIVLCYSKNLGATVISLFTIFYMLCILKGINYIKLHLYFSKFWAGNKRVYSRHIKNKDNKADKRVLWSIISFFLGIYVYVSFRDILYQIQEASLNLKYASWKEPTSKPLVRCEGVKGRHLAVQIQNSSIWKISIGTVFQRQISLTNVCT